MIQSPKIVVGVVTYNVLVGLRSDVLERTTKSIDIAFPDCDRILLDNGSSDGTEEFILESQEISKSWQVVFHKPDDGVTTPGRGLNELIKHVLKRKPAVVVLSDDDILWKPEAGETIRKFWSESPEDPVILGGLFEPDWHWNTPRELITRGGVKALVRDSCPSAAWTFLSKNWSKIGPVSEEFGHDYETCMDLKEKNKRVAQIDLAEHLGWGLSSHGNDAIEVARFIDKEKWGLT
jgi:GT2 family glycosyltransferase